MKSVFYKWLVLVSLNSSLSFFFGLIVMENSNNPFAYVCGMVVGVLVFVSMYTWAEINAQKENNLLFIQSLTVSVIIKAVLQLLVLFTPLITLELWIGTIAIDATNLNGYISADSQSSLFNGSVYNFFANFFTSLFATLITGFCLSFVVVIISAPIYMYLLYRDNR